MNELSIALVATSFGFGFRHGIDWDHIAAIGDITSSSPSRRRAFELSTVYAAAHSLVVAALGTALIISGFTIGDGLDRWFGRTVGLTLVLLGAWVLVDLRRRGDDYRLRSRAMIVVGGIFRGVRRVRRSGLGRTITVDHHHAHGHAVGHAGGHGDGHDHGHEHDVVTGNRAMVMAGERAVIAAGTHSDAHSHAHSHRHDLLLADDPFSSYGRVTATGIGLIHGIGVESPTQIVLFVAATHATGQASAMGLLGVWVFGLVVANTVVAVLTSYGVHQLGSMRRFHLGAGLVVGSASLVLGGLMMIGADGALPALS